MTTPMKESDLPIASPCGQDWEGMDPRDKSRFCGECKKVVHDLRSMKEKDARKLLSTPSTEGLCVRYMYDEVGNIWFADSFFMRTEGLLKKVAAAAAIASAPFLTACMGAYAGPDGIDPAVTQDDGGSDTDSGDPGYPNAQVDGGASSDAAANPLPGCGQTADAGADAAPQANGDDAAAPDPNAGEDAGVDPGPSDDADASVDPDPNADPDAGGDPVVDADDAGAPSADDAGAHPECKDGVDRHGHIIRRCYPKGGPRKMGR
jgi:hypothetical protein